MLRLTVVAAAVLLSGCAAIEKNRAQDFLATQPESAWGNKPPDNHLEMEKALTLARLKDPMSAQIAAAGELKRAMLPAGFASPSTVPVYCSYLSVNAKNSFGGYTGPRLWEYCYNNGKLFSVWDGSNSRVWLD